MLTAVICVAWIVPGLIGHDPWKPDEAYTFGVVYEIIRGGSWIIPTLAGEPFLDAPPLFHLTAALCAKLLSPLLALHDAARLASGIYMGFAFLFCGLAGQELNGERRGAVATLLLLGCFGLAVRGHQLITDTAALAGFTVAYYGLALALRRPWCGGFWLGTGLGLVFMSQGLLEPAMIAVTAAVLPLFAPWRRRRYLTTLAMAVVTAAPWLLIWPILLHSESPALFSQWLWQENVARLFARGSEAGLLYYSRILPWYAWPVWPIALWVLWRTRTAALSTPAIVLPLAGFLITFGLLSTTRESRELYALPLLVPLSLLAAAGVQSLRRGAANAWYWFSITAFTFFVIVGWFYWSGLELGVPARLHAHLHRVQRGYDAGFRLVPFSLAMLFTIGWLALAARLPRNADRPVVIWAAGLTTVWALAAILFITWVDARSSYRSMVVSLQQALPQDAQCISSRRLGEGQRAMLHYFGGIVTHREEVPARRRKCDLMLVQGHPRHETPPRGAWRKIWEGGRPGDRDERYRLYQRLRPPG